jgi:ubiquinone/menaquinone biosynthesis C-methylase UbiE
MFHRNGPTFFELAQQALSSTERGYDLLAPKFDYTPFRTPQFLLELVRDHLQRLAPFDRILDVCCGTGAAMATLLPLCRRQVVGLDFSRGMLAVGQAQASSAPGEACIDFVRGDALAMPFASAFDLAVCFGALGHIPRRDEPRFAAELVRVLRPGGRFVFVTSYLPRKRSARYWLARAFNGAMRVRNMLWRPPFIMYYLTFLLPEAAGLFERLGCDVEVEELATDLLPAEYRLVTAARRKG